MTPLGQHRESGAGRFPRSGEENSAAQETFGRRVSRTALRRRVLAVAALIMAATNLTGCATTSAPGVSTATRPQARLQRLIQETRSAEAQTKLSHDYVRAVKAYLSGHGNLAARLCRTVIKGHGPVGAQFLLGLLYWQGRGVERNRPLGLAWIERAAAGGSALSQADLAYRYYTGNGLLPRDLDRARYWARLAAAHGSQRGAAILCRLESHGRQRAGSRRGCLNADLGNARPVPHSLPSLGR